MDVQFRNSFAKDLRSIDNKTVLDKVKETIELVEKVQNPQEIQISRS